MLAAVFPPHAVFRIDHHLGKETVQNLLAMRFSATRCSSRSGTAATSTMYGRSRWPRTSRSGSGGRGAAGYYDGIGAAEGRGIQEPSSLQLLDADRNGGSLAAFLAAAESLRAEKEEKALAAVQIPADLTTPGPRRRPVLVRMAGAGSRSGVTSKEEDGIPPDSVTETYAAIRLSDRQPAVVGRCCLSTCAPSKRLPTRMTEIAVIFPARAAPALRCDPDTKELGQGMRWSSGCSRTRAKHAQVRGLRSGFGLGDGGPGTSTWTSPTASRSPESSPGSLRAASCSSMS